MLQEAVDHLVTDHTGIYVDATLGGGGHSAEILRRLQDEAVLYGIDQDDEALEAARKKLGNDPRLQLIKGNFGYLSTLIPPESHNKIAGVLLDLGVSTHQITEADRGFSFQEEGPLDMRMSNLTGLTAEDVVNTYDHKKLADVIYHYGEERLSRPIASAIIKARPLKTTAELRDVVKSVVKGPHQVKSLARVFQAIRIEVNQELDVLRSALEQAHKMIKLGGRIVAISYHSLEDRIVKHYFKSGNHEGRIEKDFYGRELKTIKMLYNSPLTPSEEEIERNPASRSAKLRIGEKIEPEGSL